jgi:hypothetical protein
VTELCERVEFWCAAFTLVALLLMGFALLAARKKV